MKMIVALPALVLAASPVAARTLRDRPYTPTMAVIPAGTATLGSTGEETTREGRTPTLAVFEHPLRTVTIARPFALGAYHVTRREFAAFAAATRRRPSACVVLVSARWSDGPDPAYSWASPGWRQRGDEPVTCVNWDDANAYAAWLTAKTGHRYRLPTEAEWEYAARAGTATARWWGNSAQDLCLRANGGDRSYAKVYPSDRSANLTCDDGYPFTSPAGRYPASPWGLHDMYGNAWQWVADCFAAVPGAPSPAGACPARSIRGGSWHSSVATLRSATRFSLPQDMRSSSLGFRVLREM